MLNSDPDLQIIKISSMEVQLSELGQLLSVEERERIKRFAFSSLARDYTIVRGCLRIFLGELLSLPPEDVLIGYSEFGKPYLLDPPFPLFFNVSHSGDYSVFAFSRSSEVGVDIEAINPEITKDRLENLIFSEKELEIFNKLPPEEKTEAFYRVWTQKEAILKADGKGLREDLKGLEVPLDFQETLHLTFKGQEYSLFNSKVAQNYLVSLVKVIN